MTRLVFLGPPGAGKGTFAAMLMEQFSLVHISTGDILRAEMKAGTPLGHKAGEYVRSGELVPDDVIAGVIERRMNADDVKRAGFVLDGFPRTVPQAELLETVLQKRNWKLDAAILFEAERDLLISRLTARRICRDCGSNFNVLYSPPVTDGICDKCGGELYQRADDNHDTAVERLAVYDRQTAPLINFYEQRGALKRIYSGMAKDDVFSKIRETIGI